MVKKVLWAITLTTLFLGAPQGRAQADKFNEEVNCLATMVYHEARGEPLIGQVAVAYTAVNRAQSGCYPNSVCAVVRQKHQYVGMAKEHAPKAERDTWKRVKRLALKVYLGVIKDPTRGAMWFHEGSIKPKWSKSKTPTLFVGEHQFYVNSTECSTSTKYPQLIAQLRKVTSNAYQPSSEHRRTGRD